MATRKQVERAAKALEKAWYALEPFAQEIENPRWMLRRDIREYGEFLEKLLEAKQGNEFKLG